MNRIFTTLLVLGAMGAAHAQDASENWTIGDVEVQPFDRMIVKRGLDVDIEIGDVHSVQIQTLNMPNDAVFVKQRGNTLIMGTKWSRLFRYAKEADHVDTEVKIIVPRLTYLKLKMAGESTLTGTVTGEELTLRLKGAADLDVEAVQVDKLNCYVRGAAVLSIASGTADEQKVRLRGASEYEAEGLETNYTDIRASGAAESTVWATDWLKATSRGAADIYYVSEPRVQDVISLGAGDVIASK